MEASPSAFKGIALFTPGGDVIYCIDPQKQIRWHVHLCSALQNLLDLPELPHFLVPCYTATIDRYFHPRTNRVQEVAEASPLVFRYQPLLNALFQTPGLRWDKTQLQQNICDPVLLSTYRSQFPQLWKSHDLIVRYEQAATSIPQVQAMSPFIPPVNSALPTTMHGYVLRLFVSGNNVATQRTLQKLHQLLEQTLTYPYTLKVIDVAQHPEQAEQDQVKATPTLVRVYPPPVRRIVGNFDNVDQILGVLEFPDNSSS